MWTVVAFLILAAGLCGIYLQNVYAYWEKKKVPTPPYKYFWGNMLDVVTLKKGTGEYYADVYRKFEGFNYVGIYKFLKPAVVLRSPDVIKTVMVKDFKSFHQNDFHINEKDDFIFAKNPFVLSGAKWKEVRNQVTPSFSGSKIKSMVSLLQENCDKMVGYLESNADVKNGAGIELKRLASLYTCENVASCAFGLNGRSFEDPNAEFITHARTIDQPSTWSGIQLQILFMFPSLAKIFKVRLFSEEISRFLRNIVQQTIKFRKENNETRNDFLDLMVSLRSKINDEKIFNEDDIVAHAGGFLLDGFETSSSAISHTLYEIAMHKDVQDKLRVEIEEILSKYNGEMTYDAIQEMRYLDCVVKESLRLHPPLANLLKICTETFAFPELQNDDGPKVTIQAGTPIIIPVYGLHTDKKYFPDPECFNPDRFSDDNKDNIVKFTYLPFGDGPRVCLGMKFGLLQTMMGVATVVKNFTLEINKKTKSPIRMDPTTFLNNAVGGLWINFTKI